MPPVSHQTIKLSRGRHSSPEHGACVMELASMLAGEGFSDHPRSVSRPIASFLRGYNDLVDDRRREDLYGYAAQAVGTAGCRADRGGPRGAPAGLGRRAVGAPLVALAARADADAPRAKERSTDPEPAGTYAVHAIGKVNDESHAAALALVDELIAMGAGPVDESPGRARPGDERRARSSQAAGRSASSSRLCGELRERLALEAADGVLRDPEPRPVSTSGVGSSPPTP